MVVFVEGQDGTFSLEAGKPAAETAKTDNDKLDDIREQVFYRALSRAEERRPSIRDARAMIRVGDRQHARDIINEQKVNTYTVLACHAAAVPCLK
jgi:hypothetical protein